MLTDTMVTVAVRSQITGCGVEQCFITEQENKLVISLSILREGEYKFKRFKVPVDTTPELVLVTTLGRGLALQEVKPSPKRNWSEILIYESVEWIS